jgi:hypothetical protein
MVVVAPSILIVLFHWMPRASWTGGTLHSTKFIAYDVIGALMWIISVLLDSIAISHFKSFVILMKYL